MASTSDANAALNFDYRLPLLPIKETSPMPPSILYWFYRRTVSIAAVISLCLALLSCTFEHTKQTAHGFLRQTQLATQHRIDRSNDWVLNAETAVCLANPVELGATDRRDVLPRGHHQLTQALYKALMRGFADVRIPQTAPGLTLAAQESALAGCAVLLVPRIIEAGDQLNSWKELYRDYGVHPEKSPGKDKLLVQVLIYDVVKGKPIDIATVHSATGFWTLKERVPSGLFEQAMLEYVVAISSMTQR
jgi:hypothetical protein